MKLQTYGVKYAKMMEQVVDRRNNVSEINRIPLTGKFCSSHYKYLQDKYLNSAAA